MREQNAPELEALALFGQARAIAEMSAGETAVAQARAALARLERLGHFKAKEVRHWIQTQV